MSIFALLLWVQLLSCCSL